MARFSSEELQAQQREQLLQQEHEHHLAARHRADTVELAGRLRHQVVGASQHSMLEALGTPGVRLVEIKPQRPTGTARTPFEQTIGDVARYILVPSGAEVPEYAAGGEEIPLEVIAANFHETRGRARRLGGHAGMPDAPAAVVAREKARMAAELATRLEGIREQLPALAMKEIEHVKSLSSEERALIQQVLTSGTERQKQELMLVRRAVQGPDGNTEAAVMLAQWSPDSPRPSRQSLGAGGAILNLAELSAATLKRAEASERYGSAALEEFPGFRGEII